MAAIEAGADLALIIFSSTAIMLLLGSSLDTAAGLTLVRVAGAALLAPGIACWLAWQRRRSYFLIECNGLYG
jgi:hypothetical protein